MEGGTTPKGVRRVRLGRVLSLMGKWELPPQMNEGPRMHPDDRDRHEE